jgi:flagellum-specific ATP synthase
MAETGTAEPRGLAPGNPLLAVERVFHEFLRPGAAVRRGGRVAEVSATHFRVRGLSRNARLGDVVEFRSERGMRSGEIVQINAGDVVVAPYENCGEVALDHAVYVNRGITVMPDERWCGRAVDALGRPIDEKGPLPKGRADGELAETPAALLRQRVEAPFRTGVRVIDIFTPLCYGQRIGVFAGSGVGKSTLLAMLAAADAFDTVVVSLVGERGREVREFLEDTIGTATMAKTIAVVATSDESAMMRRRAPDTAMRVAE